MSWFFNREPIRYILLKRMKVDLGNWECGVLPRGQTFIKLHEYGPYNLQSGFLPLSDDSRGLKFLCPAEGAARLTEAEAKYLMGIASLEDRYEAFIETRRFENPFKAGSKVFVTVNGREYPGVVEAVLFEFPFSSDEPMFEVEIQECSLPDESVMFSGVKLTRLSSNGNLIAFVCSDMLRPRNETNEMLRRRVKSFPEDYSTLRLFGTTNLQVAIIEESDDYLHSRISLDDVRLDWKYVPLPTIAEQRQDRKEARKSLFSTKQALNGDERDPANLNSEQISDRFEKQLTIEQERKKELELKSNELERKLALEQEAKKEAEHRFQTSEQRVQELETTLVKERHAHEQTKENLRERSEQLNKLDASVASTQKALEEKENDLISIKQILATSKEIEKQHEGTVSKLNELQRKITCEQNAREEAEKRLQCLQEKTQELETTLATARNVLKRTSEPENECEWILNREEIHFTEEKLGSGAFGTVYKGMFRGTQVAVKQVSVKPRITQYNMGNFKREMKMASRCRHPCMLQFIGATSDDQSPLLVTELLDTSLKAVLLERALDPVEIETIALDVAKGLNYLHLNHPHPIVHRDISSGNLLLWKHGQSWRGKISDYGNAVLMNYARTGSGGALSYLAPEMNNQRFSTKCDVYSYGVLLLEMCLREEPSCCDNRDKLICFVEDGGRRDLIRSCLEQDPTQRPTMEKVIAVLRASQLTGTN